MLIDLLSIYVIVWIIKTAVADTAHAVKGTPNPRYELKRQRALAAGNAAPTRPRYGSRDWVADLVSDGLVAQTERRRRKADEKAKPKSVVDEQKTGGAGRVDDMVDVAGVRAAARGAGDLPGRPHFGASADGPPNANARPNPARVPSPTAPGSGVTGQRPRPGAGQAAAQQRAPGPHRAANGVRPNNVPQSSVTPQPIPAASSNNPTPSSEPRTDGQAAKPAVDLEQVREVMASGVDICLGCGRLKVLVAKYWAVGGEVCADCASKVNPKDLRPLDGAPLAPVIPLFRTPNKEKIMPTVDGEVTGLDPAISYAKALAHFAGEHGQAGNEGYIGFLAQSKVKGAGLQTATDMQEAFANAQAAADRHAAELNKQKTVQEAYDQNPDAGDKAFQQNGR